MDTIQIELTNACVLKCSNCTRFCGHREPFFLSEEKFRSAIDSLAEFARDCRGIVGIMGGEPTLHPQFSEFCDYAVSKIPREKLGLWSTFPESKKGYSEVIARTFGSVLLNDHSRDDVFHAPVLMAAEDYFTNDADLFLATERCWVQESWSACVNSKGAWFCEVAGALSELLDGPEGWPVEPGWWKRTSKDFTEQREWACRRCGAALPLCRTRNTQDSRDDVSRGSMGRLVAIKSRKVTRGEVEVHDKFDFDPVLVKNGTYPKQTYQDEAFRKGIAARYGISLSLNPLGYWEPHFMGPDWKPEPRRASLFQIIKGEYDKR
jgi:hypothetical protein